MHYIRFLKSPRLVTSSTPHSLTAKITITTDLGESFLLSNIILAVELELEDRSSVLGRSKARECTWKGRDGMRTIEVAIPVPTSSQNKGKQLRMLIRPLDGLLAVENFATLLDSMYDHEESGEAGGVVAVRSMPVDINPAAKSNKINSVGMAERVFSTTARRQVRIWEETGESIARHIWDAGLVLSSFLTSLSSNSPSSTLPKMPVLEKVLKKRALQVLELGAGCGIVGISLAPSLPNISHVILTDLPEATEIIEKNLSASTLPPSLSPNLAHQVLDWSSPLPPNIKDAKWDLVLVADCTYNPDVVPDLVRTLVRLAEGNEGFYVLLAMKVRHESEMVFFDLMRESGFAVWEKCKIPLPVLGDEAQEIEIFGFGYQK